jgi:hypothetical protein
MKYKDLNVTYVSTFCNNYLLFPLRQMHFITELKLPRISTAKLSSSDGQYKK